MCEAKDVLSVVTLGVLGSQAAKMMDTPKAPEAPAPIETPTPDPAPAPRTAPAPTQMAGGNTTVMQQAPVEQTRGVQEARDRERRMRLRRMSSSSTLATGGAGVTAPAETGVKTLLGA